MSKSRLRELDQLSELYFLHKKLYMNKALIGVSSQGIHLSTEGFNEFFGDSQYTITKRGSTDYKYEAAREFTGIKFYCIGNDISEMGTMSMTEGLE